jgi:Immunity protein 22
MPVVHVFVSSARFASFEEMRSFIDPGYTQHGDLLPSTFLSEVRLRGYEPACIEAFWKPHPCRLPELLQDASFAQNWLPLVDPSLTASEAICVFEPNQLERPSETSLRYLGEYVFEAL